MRQRRVLIFLLATILIIVAGLMMLSMVVFQGQGQQVAFESTSVSIRSTNAAVEVAIAATQASRQTSPVSFNTGEKAQPSQDRLVIKNATMSIIVDNAAEVITTIGKLAAEQGGWVVNSETYQRVNAVGNKDTYGSIAIRIPAERLDASLDRIKSEALSVESLNIKGDDVTEQYSDLTSQLSNLQQTEDQLRKIMDSATKTEDVLAVYRQVSDVHGHIEGIKGKLKYYEQSAAYSSIAVSLSPKEVAKPISVASAWELATTFKSAFEFFVSALRMLVDLIIWFVVGVLPFLILFYIAYRIFRRFQPRSNSVSIQPMNADQR